MIPAKLRLMGARQRAGPPPAHGTAAMILDVFVPGALKNYANGRVHWRTEAAYRKRWRQLVCLLARRYAALPRAAPEAPKQVRLIANTYNTFDDDGLRNACKPLVDGLVDAGVIHSDAPTSGHDVRYGQRIDRTRRGVEITITVSDE